MNTSRAWVAVYVLVGLLAGAASALNIETVPVGNPGNAGEPSGVSVPGGYGPGRVCGAVGYTYSMGKYEVTAGQYCEFLNAVAGVDTYALYSSYMLNASYGSGISRSGSGTTAYPYTYTVASDFINRPVNYLSWGDAARFANWLHNGQPTGMQDSSTTEEGSYSLYGATSDAALLTVTRNPNATWVIPTEDEWYKAAYHKNDGVTGNFWDYPTCSDVAPGRDLADVSGNNANYRGTPYPIQSPYYTTAAGEFQNSDSPYGTFDQGGNVWEWNESIVYDSSRCLRAGAFSDNWNSDTLLASIRYNHEPTYEIYHTGFRMAYIPEPATLLLLAVGGPAVMRRR